MPLTYREFESRPRRPSFRTSGQNPASPQRKQGQLLPLLALRAGDNKFCPLVLKPNDLGLFDDRGNVYGWCQERYKEYPAGNGDEAIEDQEDGLVIVSTDSRMWRGDSFINQASNVRSARRYIICADELEQQLRFPSGEDFYALTALLLYNLDV
ncbi:MAG: SUMF1/EgtB/PvdO family nonheme iron enzyme [Gemmataceae bacterium]